MDDIKEADANNEAEAGSTTEVNLRLDSDGRTTYDPTLRPPPTSSAASTTKTDDHAEHSSKKAKIEAPDSIDRMSLDYSSKTTLTNLASIDATSSSSFEKAMNDLLFDCEIADSGLMPRTFWVPATGAPRCYLEKIALEVYHHHVPQNSNCYFYDPATSGAEWWVQLRPSPPGTGRYSMLADDDNGNGDDDDMQKSGISFHWDKDEDLRLMCGGSMYIHPHISTVTYLTDLGAPTMVLTKRVDPMTGQYVQEVNDDGSASSSVEGLVSWPKRGKHLSFDGRYLHAAPGDLMEEGVFERQCSYDVTDEMDEATKKLLARKHRRVTFLVNVWLNYRPFNVNPFPATMIANLSKIDLFGDLSLFGSRKGSESDNEQYASNRSPTKTVIVREGNAMVMGKMAQLDDKDDNDNAAIDAKLSKMTWSMGQKDEESIEVLMPVESIRSQGETGSDCAIVWNDGVVLSGSGA